MKKILLISVLLMSTSIAICQDDDEDDNRLNSIRLGYQLSNLVNSDEDAAANLNSFYIGYTRQKRLGGIFRLETGLEYMMGGAKITDSTKWQLHYLVLPVQLHLKLGPFIGTAGLNADFKIKEKVTVAGNEVDINDDNKSTFMDCTADLGVGFKIWFLTLEARYYYGLVDINEGWHNSFAQLGLKFSF